MNQIQTELPMLRHAGAVIEYTVHEDDLEERDFPPIQEVIIALLVPAKEGKYIVSAHQLVPTIPTRTFSIIVS